MNNALAVALGKDDRRTAPGFRSVPRNTLLLLVGQLLVQASTALIGILVARHLGRESYGQYALAFSFSGTAGQLFSLGVDSIVVREVAREPLRYRAIFGAALWIRLVMLPVITVGMTLVAVLLGYEVEQRGYIFMAALVLGMTTLSDVPRSIFQARQQMVYDTLTRSLDKVVALVLVFVAVMVLGVASVGVVLGLTLAGGVTGLIAAAFILVRRFGAPALGHPREALQLVRISLPLMGSMILLVIYEQLPTIMLSRFHPYTEVASYNAALSLVLPFGLLAMAVQGALLPALAVSMRGRGLDPRAHGRAVGINLLLALPICISLYITAPLLIHALYGAAFDESIGILRVLILLIPILYTSIYGNTLYIAGAIQQKLLLIVLLNLALTVLLGFVLIPAGGSLGAVIVRILAPSIGTVVMLVLAPRWLRRAPSGATTA